MLGHYKLPPIPRVQSPTHEQGVRAFQFVVALAMMLYALAIVSRPTTTGIPAFITASTGLPPNVLALIFATCAGALFVRRMGPVGLTICTVPLALYALFGLGLFISNPNVAFQTFLGHILAWATVNIFAWLEVDAHAIRT